MKLTKPITSALSLSVMIILSGCSDKGDSSDSASDTGITIADSFTITLDVDEADTYSDWSSATSVGGSSASVVTNGSYGNCLIHETDIVYVKTTETNATDSCILSVDNSKYIKVNIETLFWKQVSAGQRTSSGIKSDGTLWSWGYDGNKQLARVSSADSTRPVQERTKITTWKSVSVGAYHTVAIQEDGTLWSWGQGLNGELGNGQNPATDSGLPTQEDSNSTNWSSASAGQSFTSAIKTDGTLWSWGDGSYGQLANGSTSSSNVPVQEDSNSTSWTSVDTGNQHAIALKNDGTLWSWGGNYYGQIGDSTRTNRTSPTQEKTLSTWKSISAGIYHSTAVKTEGTLWSWGYNNFGAIGDNTTTNRSIPTRESNATQTWESVSAAGYHTVAIRADKSIWGIGYNAYGELGTGDSTHKLTPTQESTEGLSWVSFDTGANYTLAISKDGRLWSWGRNHKGQLGDESYSDKEVPHKAITRSSPGL